ncbi:MAG: hypothetical protein NUV80_04975 [Candidatus Berkelbacteria bacterium]|nr:hypothetical protein [Candidatus Berkelbacteria bacterium]
MTNFILTALVFGLLAWLSDKYIPTPIGRIVGFVIIIIWVLKYLLPFLGVSI